MIMPCSRPGARWSDEKNSGAAEKPCFAVRGADTERPDLHAASGGLFAAALGMSALFGADDRATLRHAMVLYDALYLWCRHMIRRHRIRRESLHEG